jgi:hypothetical protein
MMGIFKRSLNNSATAVAPAPAVPARPIIQPGNTTVHHHGPNWIGIIIGSTLAALLILAALWFALVYLFYQIGSPNPWRDAAGLVIYGGLIAAGLFLLSWRAGPFFDSWLAYKSEVQKEITRREEVKLLAAQTTLEPGRMNEADFRFARVILAVMMIAYDWLETNNLPRFPRRWRPWSKTETLKTAEKIGIEITQDKALYVAKWLAEEGIITSPDSGQIAPAFPTLSSVRAHLDNKYGKPIVVVSPTLRDNRGFKFTG